MTDTSNDNGQSADQAAAKVILAQYTNGTLINIFKKFIQFNYMLLWVLVSGVFVSNVNLFPPELSKIKFLAGWRFPFASIDARLCSGSFC